MSSISVLPKKTRGRPPTGSDPVTSIRLAPEMVAALDRAREGGRLGDGLSRSDVIRSIVAQWLQENGYLSKGGE